VFAVSDLAEDYLGSFLCVLERDLASVAERDPAVLRSDLVLRNERAVLCLIPDANAQTESWHRVVEFDMLVLAGFNLELVNGGLSELDGLPLIFGKILGRCELSSRVFPCPQFG